MFDHVRNPLLITNLWQLVAVFLTKPLTKTLYSKGYFLSNNGKSEKLKYVITGNFDFLKTT